MLTLISEESHFYQFYIRIRNIRKIKHDVIRQTRGEVSQNLWLAIRFKIMTSCTWVFLPSILVYICYVRVFIPYIQPFLSRIYAYLKTRIYA